MEVYLADSGGLMRAYLKSREREKWTSTKSCSTFGSTERESAMDLYLADTSASIQSKLRERERDVKDEYRILNGAKILQSFFYCDDFTENEVIPRSKQFLLDSGAFTFFGQGKKVDWNLYLERYADFIRRNNIEHYFELDIDPLVGYQKVLEMRKTLERMTDRPVIPVWHKSRGKDEFVKMCKEYDYIAIGGIVTKEIPKDKWPVFSHLIDIAHKEHCRIHGLGFTSLAYLPRYHFDSVDSTSWTSGNRFGSIYTFDGRGKMVMSKRPEGTRIFDPRKVALHNFGEWKRFSEWAEVHL